MEGKLKGSKREVKRTIVLSLVKRKTFVSLTSKWSQTTVTSL